MFRSKKTNDIPANTSIEGLKIGEKTQEGALYAGVSTVKTSQGKKIEYDLFIADGDLKLDDQDVKLRGKWSEAIRAIGAIVDLHGKSGSTAQTEAQLNEQPQKYDGGWMLPTIDELRKVNQLMKQSDSIARSFNEGAFKQDLGWYWSSTEMLSIADETNGLMTKPGKDKDYVRDLMMGPGYESWDRKEGVVNCAVRPVYRVQRP